MRLDLHPHASKFNSTFNLSSSLACLANRTWNDSDTYEIIEEGFKQGHGRYFVYVFTLLKVIGIDPWGFPSRKICIYFSWRPSTDQRFHIISAYPYSASYEYFFEAAEERIFHVDYSTKTNGSFRSHQFHKSQ